MAMGNPVVAAVDVPTGGVSAPVSLTSSWVTLVGAGLIAAVDNAGSITNTATQVVRTGTTPLSFVQKAGTHMALRVRYPAGLTITQQPKVSVRGKTGEDPWEQRKNIAGSDVVELTLNPTTDEKSADGLWQYSYVDPGIHLWDRLACAQLVPGIVQAMTATGGVITGVTIEGKVL